MNDDQHKSVQIKKNHITNDGMVEKTNDPKNPSKRLLNSHIQYISSMIQGTKDLKELSHNSSLIKISLKPPMMNPTTKNR